MPFMKLNGYCKIQLLNQNPNHKIVLVSQTEDTVKVNIAYKINTESND